MYGQVVRGDVFELLASRRHQLRDVLAGGQAVEVEEVARDIPRPRRGGDEIGRDAKAVPACDVAFDSVAGLVGKPAGAEDVWVTTGCGAP